MSLHVRWHVSVACGVAAACLPLASAALAGSTGAAIDRVAAKAVFAEARALSDKDAGRLWGERLYGPILLVDPQTRSIVANEADGDGQLRSDAAGLYEGHLPDSVLLANTPTQWAGMRWTMLLWPLPEDRLTRDIMLAHEQFHRVQPTLHLDAPDTPNLQLDAADGRTWLQLEWRALAAALATSGPAQTQAVHDALAFRAARHAQFAGSARSEASLEIAEGVPEYTGTVIGAPDRDSGLWRTIGRLSSPDPSLSFVRGFAYTSGPAYGLLLDERAPGWRKQVGTSSDLSALLAATVRGTATGNAEVRAQAYGAAAIRVAEADRSARLAAQRADYQARLVDGPTLTIPAAGHFSFSFNPSMLVSIGDAAVYPTFHATDAWGRLDVTNGVRLPTDFSKAVVQAPDKRDGPHIAGPGWTLDLAPGWQIVAGTRPGDFTLRRQ